MTAHYKSNLREFLKANRNMKTNIRTEGLLTKPEYNDSGDGAGETEQLLEWMDEVVMFFWWLLRFLAARLL